MPKKKRKKNATTGKMNSSRHEQKRQMSRLVWSAVFQGAELPASFLNSSCYSCKLGPHVGCWFLKWTFHASARAEIGGHRSGSCFYCQNDLTLMPVLLDMFGGTTWVVDSHSPDAVAWFSLV
jgi:hypothetical protein